MATTQNLEELLSFFRKPSNKCFWNEDVVEVKESSFGGTGVFAVKDLSPEDEDDALLLRISKESILSSKNSCISNLLNDSGVNGIHAMILAFIYERAQGENSPWHSYINSINLYDEDRKMILPPSLWSEDEKSLLKGTEAEVLGALDTSEPEEFFALSVQFAKNNSNLIPIPDVLSASASDSKEENLEKYHLFVTICAAIASRAFSIDDYHGTALVPGADLFNHNCYHEENVHFETISDVCPFCGSADECGHNTHGPPDSEDENDSEEWEEMDVDGEEEVEDQEEVEDEDEDEDEDLEPIDEITTEYIEKMEEEMKAENESEEEEEEEEDEEPNDDEHLNENSDDEIDSEDDESLFLIPDDCVDIVVRKELKLGEEIFNTYGDLSNSVLISRYGFSAPHNPNDYVGLGRQALKAAKLSKWKTHFEFWEEKGFEMFQEYLYLKKQLEKEVEHEHEHEHEHGNGHDHEHEHGKNDDSCGDGCCDDGCCDGEEEEPEFEDSWELELRIRSDGEPSESTYALANLLTLSEKEVKKVALYEDPEVLIQGLDALTLPNKAAYKILQGWCEERAKLYTDGNMNSADYDAVIAKLGNEPHKRFISILIQSEKAILEKCLTGLLSRV